MTSAITFDFHNTLIACDPWFEIEVRSLCSRFLAWRRGGDVEPALSADVDRRYRVLRAAIIEHGNELTASQCIAVVLAELDIPISAAELETGVEAIMMPALEFAAPIDGAAELVAALLESGVPLAIVSSAVYHPFLDAALDRFGLRDAFGAVVTSASSGFYKSRPEIYWTALDAIGAKPDRALHVGDSYKFDVLGGKRAGMATAWLTSDPEAQSKEPAPDLIIAGLGGVAPAILATLNAGRR